ncbi:MAG: YcxB family protein [Lachnospiraceae bacterium]|jgi:hypothetical protein|nr:YcxB family protein [Lachnospiraceae bacterium]
MKTVQLVFKYSKEEYVKAARQYLLAGNVIKMRDVMILMILILAAVFYLFFSSFSLLSIVALIVLLLVGMVGLIIYFYLPVVTYKRTLKFHEEYRLTFSDQGIRFKTPRIDTDLSWESYINLWESTDFYFLVQAPKRYSILPKRAFADVYEQDAFEKMALLNMQCDKRLL